VVRVFALLIAASAPTIAGESVSVRLPDSVPPVIGCWFWGEGEFAPGGYRGAIDLFADHAAYNLLSTSLRVPLREVTEDAVRDQIAEAARYARKRGIGLLMDLDVRLARAAYSKAYPDELQEMLRLREMALGETGQVSLRITSEDLNDHYTHGTTHYIPLAGRLVRVYSYVRGPAGIEPGTVRDITQTHAKATIASAADVRVAIDCNEQTRGRTACVMVSFTHLTPAVFAPHLLEFQRQIIERYADVPLAGVCKDEWGFPPCYDGCPAKNDFWYSRFRESAYAKRTGGRDLVRDCLLMTFPERGRERERQAVINHFMDMSRLRNGAVEDDFHKVTKATFGPSAISATHATWYPYPGVQEIKKNGLHWWIATRDYAQTDEVTPYCVRTSLAKKWGGAVWYNMYYSSSIEDYHRQPWAGALTGGRVNYHPVWPIKGKPSRYAGYEALLRGGLMRGDCRVRLLNFITSSPLDCPVAVIFGHACAMNWAGPAYGDTGVALADAFWRAGYPADLIPSSEIGGQALRISDDGSVQYGPQRYSAVMLYHPEFEKPAVASFFRKAARGETMLYRSGDWTVDFEGKPFDGDAALPKEMVPLADDASGASAVIARLRERGVAPQTPATETMKRFGYESSAPPTKGRSRLIDGTHIIVAATEQASGDPIDTTLEVDGYKVVVDAVGVVGVRLAKDGRVEALAAGGLRQFKAGSLEIDLPCRADLAIWTDAQGTVHGVLQDWQGPIPEPLTALTTDWLRLALPLPVRE